MTANARAAAAAHAGDITCRMCGSRLDGAHVEASENGYVCGFCGAQQSQDLLGDLGTGVSTTGRPGVGQDVGEALRAAREERGVPLSGAAKATRIRERYLHALEEGQPLDRFPGRVYARFFLRDYAEYLGLEPDPLLRSFDGAAGPPVEATPSKPVQEPVMSPPGRRGWRVSAALTLVALLAIGVASRLGDDATQPIAPTRAAAPPVDETTPPDADTGENVAPPPERVDEIRATLRVTDRSWVEAVGDGEQLLAETLEAGRVVRLRADRSFALFFGNAPGVELVVNGRPVRTDDLPAVVELSWAVRDGELVRTGG